MSVEIRVLLIVASLFNFWYIARKLRKSQVNIVNTVFWILTSLLFIVLAIWPQIAIAAADALGVISAVNFIYLVVIFLLLVRVFLMDIRISQLEDKLRNLVSEIAIRENEKINAKEVKKEDEKGQE